MKKLLLATILTAFACVSAVQAGEKSDKDKAACADKAKSACAGESACCSKATVAKKAPAPPRGAMLLVRK